MYTAEEIEKFNKEIIENSNRQYKEFTAGMRKSSCYLCGEKLDYFKKSKPCPHWLLKPRGFKKKHFPLLTNNFCYHQIRAYVFWLANYEKMFGNINNLEDEKNNKKYFEYTVKYKKIEWSFSCSWEDLIGHKKSAFWNKPHYHFQMRIDGRPFINYSDFHNPFFEEDMFTFDVIAGKVPGFGFRSGHATGMQEVLDVATPEKLLDSMKKAKGEKDGAFKIDTFIEANDGFTISGDEIADLYEKQKKTGETMAKLVKDMKNVKITTYIQPADSLPDIAGRTIRKR